MPQVNDFNLYTRITRAINCTFGTTGPGTARVSTQKVNLLPLDETLLRAKYQSIETFPAHKEMEPFLRMHRAEALAMIEGALKQAAENYKLLFDSDDDTDIGPEENREAGGSGRKPFEPAKNTITFKVNMDSIDDSVEFTHVSQGNPIKRGFYRFGCLVDIS